MDTDWWFLIEMMRSMGRHGAVKIILKDDPKHVPLLGWALRGLGFIFLQRDWAKDKHNLDRQLEAFMEDDFPLRLLLFPEGTTINTLAMSTCKEYAEKESRPTFNHLLLPRVTGFKACVEAFASAGGRGRPGRWGRGEEGRVVYDVTIGYTGYGGEVPTYRMGYSRKRDIDIPSIASLLRGCQPGPVHMHIEKHAVEDVRRSGGTWLDATWARKDALLEGFISEGHFPGEPVVAFTARQRPSSFCLLSSLPLLFGWFCWAAAPDVIRWLSLILGGVTGGGEAGL
ncbi:unnamed protein product [Discosporangium mesarthrocarpum]